MNASISNRKTLDIYSIIDIYYLIIVMKSCLIIKNTFQKELERKYHHSFIQQNIFLIFYIKSKH